MNGASAASQAIVVVLTIAGLSMASGALIILGRVARLSPTAGLKRAWQILSVIIGLCIALQSWALVAKMNEPVYPGDIAAAVVHLLGPTFVLVVAWLSKRTAEEVVHMARFERDALFDTLTGLPNRRCFEITMKSNARERGGIEPQHLFLIDLDHFKDINDTYGHRAGDMVLERVGTLIASHIRGERSAFRVGGEEFAAIVTGTDAEAARRTIEQLRLDIECAAFPLPGNGSTRATASIGMATLAVGESVESFVQRADDALYQAKRAGRNRMLRAA